MLKPQEVKGLKVKIFSGYPETIEIECNQWLAAHSEYTLEDIQIVGGNYVRISLFYREPDTTRPPYR